ncbi:hypothetical protein [Pseudomonas paraversuta]|uniref:hypothetical protein n=1 Tax=Pseudomonas paraversuta TaxID=2750624 RepID=UPI00193450E3|nr:hypothetical protein [Pseudomonas paraversuta]
MKQTILGMIEAGEPLLLQAIEAMRQHREAEAAGKPLAEIERLRLLADSLYQAVTDYHPRAIADGSQTLH